MTLVNFGASKTRNLESVIANFKYKKTCWDGNFSPMCNNMKLLKNKIIDEDHASRRSNISENFEEANNINDQFSRLKLIDDSCFISIELNNFFESCLPKLVKGCKRVLLYR
jgi:hypothetical protein